MKRQKTLLNFFSKNQNKGNDLGNYCTPDPQKKFTITEDPMVATEERKKNGELLSVGAKVTALIIFKLHMPGNLLIGLKLKEMPIIK